MTALHDDICASHRGHPCDCPSAALPASLPTSGSPAAREGQDAYRRGIVVGDNPFNEDRDECWEWMRGWADAGMAAQKRKLANHPTHGRDPGDVRDD